MKTRFFVTSDFLDTIAKGPRVSLSDDGTLTVPPHEFTLRRAVHVHRVLAGADRWNLLGRVLLESEVAGLGGVVDGDAVDLPDVRYAVELGFVGEEVEAVSGRHGLDLVDLDELAGAMAGGGAVGSYRQARGEPDGEPARRDAGPGPRADDDALVDLLLSSGLGPGE